MKIFLTLLQLYFSLLSRLFPQLAARQAFRLFQRTPKNKIKPTEMSYYQYAHHFQVASEVEPVNCFEMGPADGPIVLLVHGWNSRAGSLAGIGFRLMKKGYRVIGIDLPGFGYSKLSHTNLIVIYKGLKAVIEYLNPQSPISVVSHSFGSAVSSYTLAQTKTRVDKLIYLTTPNKMADVFTEFSAQMGLSPAGFRAMEQQFTKKFGKSWDDFVMRDFAQKVDYQSLLLVHDTHDRAIPYKNSVAFAESLAHASLHTLEKVGHYRMLWDKAVIDRISSEFKGEKHYSNEEKILHAAF